MKYNEKILQNFHDFVKKEKDSAYKQLKQFFDDEKRKYYDDRILELQESGLSDEDSIVKARQGWVSVVGTSLEKIIECLISDFCKKNNLKITNDKKLKAEKLSGELDLIKRLLLVHYDEYSVLPDGDIIVYKTGANPKILAILSIKNSFRERYTETPYWKIKLSQSKITKHIKVFMITPDKDDEISFVKNIKKSRIVMEYELDGIYLAKNDFDSSNKVKGIENLIIDLEKLLK